MYIIKCMSGIFIFEIYSHIITLVVLLICNDRNNRRCSIRVALAVKFN